MTRLSLALAAALVFGACGSMDRAVSSGDTQVRLVLAEAPS